MSSHRFRKATINPQLDIESIMTSQQGNEGRFKGRFIKYAGTSADFNRSVDVTGQAIEDLRTSAGMITEQKQAVDRLFVSSERAIQEVSNLERESGVHQVDNIPLPTEVVRGSYGKKMGYVSLTMGFLQEGMLHFMEEVIHLQEALDSRDRVITQLVAQIPHLEVIGRYEDVSPSDLTSAPAVDVPTYTKQQKGDRVDSVVAASPVSAGKKSKK